MKKRVADIIMETLEKNGITNAFCVPGGGAMHLNNALALSSIKTIFNHHEQACAISCEGYAKYSSKPALCCVTSGPGGTNALTGVMGAYQDYTPIFVLSGQVRYNTTVEECGLNIRRRGEQEFDIVNSVKNMTKYAKMIIDPLSIKREIQKAFDIMMSGARGPVWIDVPLDIQSSEIEEDELYPVLSKPTIKECSEEDFGYIVDVLNKAKRPIILAGSAIRSSGQREQFLKLLNNWQIPVVSACCVADNLYNEHHLYLGTTGTVGSRKANIAIQNADVILNLGCSLGFKQTTFSQDTFAPKAHMIMVNTNPDEAKKPGLKVDKFIHADLVSFFSKANGSQISIGVSDKWLNYCSKLKDRFGDFDDIIHQKPEEPIRVQEFWQKYYEQEPDENIVILGNSSCVQGRLAFSVNKKNQRSIVNINCGSMGCDIPLAIGASIAANKEVTLVTGDGSFMMNSQELATIKHNNLPIKIILFSNKGYAAIRNTCRSYFNNKMFGCSKESGLSFPDFQIQASAYGLNYKSCEKTSDLTKSISWLNEQNGSCILEINQIYQDEMLPSLKSRLNSDGTFSKIALHDMYPFLDREELKEYMINEEEKC